VDPLRAGHVAIIDARFHFFCDYSSCRERFFGRPVPERPVAHLGRARVTVNESREVETVKQPVRAPDVVQNEAELPSQLPQHDRGELIEPLARAVSTPAESTQQTVPSERDMSALLLALTLVASGLSLALELGEPTRLVRIARVVLIAVGVAAIAGRALTTRGRSAVKAPEPDIRRGIAARATAGHPHPGWAKRHEDDKGRHHGQAGGDPGRPHWLVAISSPALALAVAIGGLASRDSRLESRAIFLAATIVSVSACVMWLTSAAARAVDEGRGWVRERLDVHGRKLVNGKPHTASDSIEPGDLLLVEADETVPVDVEIVDGEADVLPWVGAAMPRRRRAGEVVVAGSRVIAGQLRGVCTHAGDDRALARPMLSAARRADIHVDAARAPRRLVERWSLLAAAIAGGLHALLGGKPLEIAMVVAAVYAAFGSLAIGTLPGLTVARGVRIALARGIVYHTAQAWERAAKVTAAVFCARGTLLRGEPELVEIELFGRVVESAASRTKAADEVLGLAASAVIGERTPGALALRRAAKERDLLHDLVRNPKSQTGGVLAVSASGEQICVGTRALLLERRISVALAEQTIQELEAAGRTVVLVARAGRLVGLCALQDGLRSGARAAVQHLLDARIEPVLMSPDTRDTCEALGRALDIDHLRAEVHDDERKDAVERIRDTGALVAVLGHTPHDDPALRAGDVSVALAAAGKPDPEPAIALVGDDVRDAALALGLAQRWRRRALSVFGLTLAPAAFGSLVITIGLLSPEYAPLAQLLGTVVAVLQLKSDDREE
jgi:cation transport ATPase